MDEKSFEKRLKKIEKRLADLGSRVDELTRRDKKLQALVLRLAATGMALSEVLQKRRMIEAKSFKRRVAVFLNALDQEITDNKISRYLENIWEEFDRSEG